MPPGDKGHNYQAFSQPTAISPSVTCQTRTKFQYVTLELTLKRMILKVISSSLEKQDDGISWVEIGCNTYADFLM